MVSVVAVGYGIGQWFFCLSSYLYVSPSVSVKEDIAKNAVPCVLVLAVVAEEKERTDDRICPEMCVHTCLICKDNKGLFVVD